MLQHPRHILTPWFLKHCVDQQSYEFRTPWSSDPSSNRTECLLNGTLWTSVALSLMSIIYELTREASFEEMSEQIADLASQNITRKSTQLVQGSDGKILIKTNDGFGNVTCIQERGPVSTFDQINPTLWYRVPLSTCGHIK